MTFFELSKINRLVPLIFSFGALSISQKGLALLISTQAIALLGASEFGRYAYVLNIVTLASMFALLGFPQLLVREISVSAALNDKARISGLVRFAVASVGAALLLSAILAVLSFSHLGIPDDQNANLWLSAFALLAALTIVGIQQAILRGANRVLAAAWPIMILQPAFSLMFLIAAKSIYTGWKSSSVFILFSISYFTASIILLIVILRDHNLRRAIIALPVYEPRKWLGSLWPFFMIGGLSMLMAQIALLVLGFFVEDEYLGYYSIAAQVAVLILLPATFISHTIEPRLAEAYARNESEKMRDLIGKLTFWSASFAFAGLAMLWFFGEFVLRIVFGLEFLAAFEPLMILATGSAISVAIGPMGIFLSMAGHERNTMIGSIFGVLLSFCLTLTLIPRLGINGAALATSISLILMKATYSWFAYKKLGIPPSIILIINRIKS